MKKNSHTILLVSLGPVDGYPPVQSQAVLLEKKGFKVILISCPLNKKNEIDFSYNSIIVKSIQLNKKSKLSRIFSRAILLLTLMKTRIKNNIYAEIHYDVDAAYYANIFSLGSSLKILHMHEAIIDINNCFYEKKAKDNCRNYDLIVVADKNRASLLKSQFKLDDCPLVVENFPMLRKNNLNNKSDTDEFKVVYAGSIGIHQALDSVIKSVKSWEDGAKLYLIGENETPDGKFLKKLSEDENVKDKIVFMGRLPLSEVEGFISGCQLGLSFLRPIHDQWKYAAGASNKRYQYMQAGIAQISDINPDVPEMIEQAGIGKCVSPDDPEAMSVAINYYINNREISSQAGNKAFILHQEKYYYELAFQKVIDWLLGSRKDSLSRNVSEI